jgi:DNA-binding LytR/AlgR family response regulator
LRVTLKKIEGQVVDNDIVRCHRSYIVNTNVDFTVHGNSNGYWLKSDLVEHSIPISRSIGKEIVQKLKE